MAIPKIIQELTQVTVAIMLVASLLGVAYLAWNHNPNYSFDESNTLRISSKSFTDISHIIKHEQNFPLFYYFLHALEVSPTNFRHIIVINFVVWLFCLAIFFNLTKIFEVATRQRIFLLTLFAISFSVTKHVFFIRMYLFLIFVGLCTLYTYQIYSETRQSKWLLIGIALKAIQVLLHPGSIIFSLVSSCASLLSRNKQLIAYEIVSGLIVSLVLISQLIPKGDFLSIHERGVEYINVLDLKFWEFPILLLHGNLIPLLDLSVYAVYLIGICYLLRQLYRTNNQNLSPAKLIMAFCTCAVFLISWFGSLGQPRHIINFISPMILSLGHALQLIGFKMIRLIFQVSLISTFSFYAYSSYLQHITIENSYNLFCPPQVLNSLIIVDYTNLNKLANCKIGPSARIIMHNFKDFFSIADINSTETLVLQAMLGGTPIASIRNIDEYLSSLNQHNDVQSRFTKLIDLETDFVYVTSVNPQGGLSEFEHNLLTNSHMDTDHLSPTIIRFTKK